MQSKALHELFRLMTVATLVPHAPGGLMAKHSEVVVFWTGTVLQIGRAHV